LQSTAQNLIGGDVNPEETGLHKLGKSIEDEQDPFVQGLQIGGVLGAGAIGAHVGPAAYRGLNTLESGAVGLIQRAAGYGSTKALAGGSSLLGSMGTAAIGAWNASRLGTAGLAASAYLVSKIVD